MELADKIDPVAVLSHLSQLGYRNITPSQLKEFIRDLKKLIIYDQLSSSSGSLTSLSSSFTSDTSEFYSPSETSDQSRALGSICGNQKSNPKSGQPKGKSIVDRSHPMSKTSAPSVHSRGTVRRGSTSTTISCEKISQKENVPLQKRKTRISSEENLQEAVKPKTSFIRPWQLQSMPSSSGRSGPSDPVSLYQYYQSIWSKYKCPGEDPHADLRWVIREKMLGQDPHLYNRNLAGSRTSKLRM